MRPWMKFILGLIAIIIVGCAVSRQAGGIGRDFQAYYKAGARVLTGHHPYVFEHAYPYKYGPAAVAPFLFFQLFEYHVARWIYCLFHIFATLAIPWLNLKIISSDKKLNITGSSYFWAIVVGFAGSLRFIDGEFQTSQISLWIYAATIAAVTLLVSAKHVHRLAGVAALAMVSQMKIHSAIMWIALSQKLFARKNLRYFWPLVLIFCLPNPAWWLEWARQIKDTTPLLPSNLSAINRQGFFGIAVLMLRWPEYGVGPWLLSIPFAVYAFLRLPRFSISELARRDYRLGTGATGLALTLLSWMLWGFMASPLPWQHTYSLLWGIIPLTWTLASTRQRQ